MAQELNIYKCSKCGNIVEMLFSGGGTLVCCGESMECVQEQTADSAVEKHVPVIEQTDAGIKVTVGSTLHPMTDEHYIQWIQILADGKSYREFLQPGDRAQAVFPVKADSVSAREYCNMHGLWKA